MENILVWKRLGKEKFGLADVISNGIAKEERFHQGLLTDVRMSKEFLLACDYGGSHQNSQYESFTFLAGGLHENWEEKRKVVREKYLWDGRRISYKKLRDKHRAKSLIPFLEAADTFPGLLLTILVDKKIESLIGENENPDFFPELIVAEKGWDKKVFHRLCVVASIGALLVAGLSKPSQDILWITDQDEIAPNPRQHNQAGWVFLHHISTYAPENHGKLIFVTTEGDDQSRRLEDLVAIADLAAGALAEAISFFHDIGRSSGSWLAFPLGEGLSDKASVILEWLGKKRYPLQRISILFEQNESGHVIAQILRPWDSSTGPLRGLRRLHRY